MGYLNEDGLATLVGKVKGQVVQLTSAEYRNLPDTKLTDNKTYFVTDEDYAYAIDDEPTLNSDNLVKSGGVYTYTSKIGSGTLSTTAQTIIPAINELDAAIDAINTGLTNITTGTITKIPAGGTLDNTVCKRVGNVVTVAGRIYDLSTPALGEWFAIPEGFRPMYDMKFIGSMYINGVGFCSLLGIIYTNGRVRMDYSSGSTTTQVQFAATYPLV